MVFASIKNLVYRVWSFVSIVLRAALFFAALHAFMVVHICFIFSHEEDRYQIFWKTCVFDAFVYALYRICALVVGYGKVLCKSLKAYLYVLIERPRSVPTPIPSLEARVAVNERGREVGLEQPEASGASLDRDQIPPSSTTEETQPESETDEAPTERQGVSKAASKETRVVAVPNSRGATYDEARGMEDVQQEFGPPSVANAAFTVELSGENPAHSASATRNQPDAAPKKENIPRLPQARELPIPRCPLDVAELNQFEASGAGKLRSNLDGPPDQVPNSTSSEEAPRVGHPDEDHRDYITRTAAREEYNLTVDDLDCEELKNHSMMRPKGRPALLYPREAVEEFVWKKRGGPEGICKAQEKKEKRRQKKLEKKVEIERQKVEKEQRDQKERQANTNKNANVSPGRYWGNPGRCGNAAHRTSKKASPVAKMPPPKTDQPEATKNAAYETPKKKVPPVAKMPPKEKVPPVAEMPPPKSPPPVAKMPSPKTQTLAEQDDHLDRKRPADLTIGPTPKHSKTEAESDSDIRADGGAGRCGGAFRKPASKLTSYSSSLNDSEDDEPIVVGERQTTTKSDAAIAQELHDQMLAEQLQKEEDGM